MKILGLTQKDSGCGYHRIINPLECMTGTRFITNYADEDRLKEGWDIILYNRLSHLDKDLQWAKDASGARVVLDLDDHWLLPPGHINYDDYLHFAPRIINNIKQADLVTVTHERLAEKVREYTDKVIIIPNALPFGDGQFHDDKVPSEVVRLMWAGGVSHQYDIDLLKNPMKRISALPVNTVIGGYNTSNSVTKFIWDKMVSSFTCGLKIPGAVLPGLPVTEYMSHYNHADICLVPLVGSEWSGMKSNLKLLEAACKRVPVVVSAVNPYLEAPVNYVHTQSDWYKNVKELVYNEDLRIQQGQALYDWANENFNLKKWSKVRQDAFAKL